MTETSRLRLALILLAGVVTTGMGWLMISEVTGTPPTDRFLYAGFALALALVAIDTWLHCMGRTRALYRLLSRATIIVPAMCFISCLLLPLFWIEEVDLRTTLMALCLVFGLYGANAVRGFRQFRAAWAARGAAALAEHYRDAEGAIDWDWIVEALRLELPMYVPLMNRLTIPLAAVAGIGGFMVAPSLVYSYPVAAPLAWTFAISCLISWFFQLLGSAAAQAMTLVDLERAAGRPLGPMFPAEALRPPRRQRKRKKR